MIKKNLLLFSNLLLVAMFALLFHGAETRAQIINKEFHGKKIEKITLTGMTNTSESDVLSDLKAMEISKGLVYSDEKLNEATKKLINDKDSTLYYAKVEVEPMGNGVHLIFKFKERKRIREIIFQGMDEIYETELRDILPVRDGDILREYLLERAKAIIIGKYQEQGLFLASVKILRKENATANTVDIIFKIDEGEIIKVQKISITGLKNLEESDLIGVMETKEDGFIADGSFNRSKYMQDRTKIVQYMQKYGYRYAKIVSNPDDEIRYVWKDEKKEERGIEIHIQVEEGKKYYFDKYSFTLQKKLDKDGKEIAPLYPKKALRSVVSLTKKGELFDIQKFMEDRQNISMLYASKGRIFARIVPQETLNQTEEVVDGKKYPPKTLISVNFDIREGPEAKIENIFIKGNKKTKDRVIRRELLVKPGEIFNSFKVQRSRERIFNLGFFKEVNLDAKPGTREPYMNLIVEVQEQPTGTISLGGGYGTQSGFSIFTEVAENNLMGQGQRLSGRFEYGPLRKQIQTSFLNPWILDDHPLSFYVSMYYMLRTYSVTSVATGTSIQAQYDKSIIGGSVGFGYRFWIFWGANIRFGVQRSTAVSATGAAADAIFQQIDLGPQFRNSVTLSLYRDTRDNVFNTTRGLRMDLELDTVGWMGDDHYKRWNPKLEFYVTPFYLPFIKNYPTVLQFRLSADFTMPPLWYKSTQRADNYLVELDDKLYAGGVETVRGWDYIDYNYTKFDKQKHWTDGGDHRILYGVEYRIPIEPSMLWFVTFIDAGGLWDAYKTSASTTDLGPNLNKKTLTMDSFVYSWGFGIRVQIPVLPIRLYMAQRLVYQGKKETGGYHGFYGFSNVEDLTFVFGIGDIRY